MTVFADASAERRAARRVPLRRLDVDPVLRDALTRSGFASSGTAPWSRRTRRDLRRFRASAPKHGAASAGDAGSPEARSSYDGSVQLAVGKLDDIGPADPPEPTASGFAVRMGLQFH